LATPAVFIYQRDRYRVGSGNVRVPEVVRLVHVLAITLPLEAREGKGCPIHGIDRFREAASEILPDTGREGCVLHILPDQDRSGAGRRGAVGVLDLPVAHEEGHGFHRVVIGR
jgi:hypothetical protein